VLNQEKEASEKLRQPCAMIPHKNVLLGMEMAGFAAPWFDNAGISGVIHCVFVDHMQMLFDDQILGLTERDSSLSCMAVGRMAGSMGSMIYNEAALREIGQCLAHELGHQFNLSDVDGSHKHVHISGTNDHCLMDTYGDEHQFFWGTTGLCEFCYWDTACPDQSVAHVMEVRRSTSH